MIILPFPHTSENLAKTISESLKEWGLEAKILAITTDGAANMIAAGRLLVEQGVIWFHNRCSAHSIQLIVNSGINEYKKSNNNFNKNTIHNENELNEGMIEDLDLELEEQKKPLDPIQKIK